MGDDDGLVRLTGFSSADEANATVRELLLHGIGATASEPDASDASGASADDQPYGVLVVDEDRQRAREILGLVDQREQEVASIDRARSSAPPLRYLIPVLLAVFILVPLIAFFAAYKASGG